MSGLMIQYSKEMAKQLTQIAVVLPGQPVSVGDVIHFPNGRARFNPLSKPKPRGAFNLVARLSELGIDYAVDQSPASPQPYSFTSVGSVSTKFDASTDVNIPGSPEAKGTLSATFSKEGATYFSAVGCTTQRMTNLNQVELNLDAHRRNIDWKETFIVTSVTTAQRALIMQSSSTSASMSVIGDVKGLNVGSGIGVEANAAVSVSGYKDAAFIKPWSENVTVFLGLFRYAKRRPWAIFDGGAAGEVLNPDLVATVSNLRSSELDKFQLEPVLAHDLLDDGDDLLDGLGPLGEQETGRDH